jgi:hypothetical protein
MIHRLRTRDLFAFAGEIILSAERRTQLGLGGGGASDRIRKALVDLLQQSRLAREESKTDTPAVGSKRPAYANSDDNDTTTTALQSVSECDIFCEIVKISYGKGDKNPVSGLTAFYEPKKNTPSASSFSPSDALGDSEASITEDPEMAQQNLHWSVGVVPQGKRGRFI